MPITVHELGSGWSVTEAEAQPPIQKNVPTFVWVDDVQGLLNNASIMMESILEEYGVKDANIALICPLPGTRFMEARRIISDLHAETRIVSIWVDIVDDGVWKVRTHREYPAADIYPGIELLRWLREQCIGTLLAAVSMFGLSPDVCEAVGDIGVPLYYKAARQSEFRKVLDQLCRPVI